MAAAGSPASPGGKELEWRFTQSFGEKDSTAEVTEGMLVL